MNRSRNVAAVAAAIVVLMAVGLFVFSHRIAPPTVAYAGTPIAPPKAADNATLIDQAGRATSIIAPDSAATFVFFGYTHCPDECPIALASLGRAYRSLDPKSRAKLRIVFVTVDPAHDTPAVLGRYVAHFDAAMTALTSSRAVLEPVWQAYGVSVNPQAKEIVDHGGTIFAVDSKSQIVLIYPPDVSAADLAHDAKLLVGA